MAKIYSSTMLMLTVFLMGAHSCSKVETSFKQKAPVVAEHKHAESHPCKSDDDCMSIKADCCGCRQGGTQKAIAKAAANEIKAEQSALCEGIMCMQAISTHESCTKEAVCRAGMCVLE